MSAWVHFPPVVLLEQSLKPLLPVVPPVVPVVDPLVPALEPLVPPDVLPLDVFELDEHAMARATEPVAKPINNMVRVIDSPWSGYKFRLLPGARTLRKDKAAGERRPALPRGAELVSRARAL